MRRPTVDRAIARVGADPDARFAALIAAVFAFSLEFLLAFLVSQGAGQEATESTAGAVD